MHFPTESFALSLFSVVGVKISTKGFNYLIKIFFLVDTLIPFRKEFVCVSSCESLVVGNLHLAAGIQTVVSWVQIQCLSHFYTLRQKQ